MSPEERIAWVRQEAGEKGCLACWTSKLVLAIRIAGMNVGSVLQPGPSMICGKSLGDLSPALAG